MDLLDPECSLRLYAKDFKIFSADTFSRPQLVSKTGSVDDCIVNQGAVIEGKCVHSVISNEVVVEKGAVVEDSMIMPGAVIKSGVTIKNAIIGSSVVVDKDKIGTQDDIVLYTEED